MHGVGGASAAVTVVNALPTGIGCAVAISIPARAEVELRRTGTRGVSRIRTEPGSSSELVKVTAAAGLSRWAPGESFSGELRIDSRIPAGKGLKSSSAVGCAVLRAIAAALHQSHSDESLARLAAEVAQQIGLSATGAFDDCLAGLRGGLAFTDNLNRTVLHADPFDLSPQVVIWVPPQTHSPSADWAERFLAEAGAGRAVVAAARAGRWGEAMTLNSELVERVMGYDYAALRADLRRLGAEMCGVSGMGPALAVLTRAKAAGAVVERLSAGPGTVLRSRLRPEGRVEEEVAR